MLKQCHSNITYQINQEKEIIIILSISLCLSNHHRSLMVSSLSINQYMRMYNGNTGMNILQINTGNGNFMFHATELEDDIHETAADIVIISESNADTHDIVEEQLRNKKFPNFVFEDKCMPGNPIARMSIMIKRGIQYERCNNMENDINSAAIVKVKISARKYLTIVGAYRQW